MLRVNNSLVRRVGPASSWPRDIVSLNYYYYQFYQKGRHSQKAKPVQGASPIVNYTIQTKQKTKTHTKTINYITIKDKTITNMREYINNYIMSAEKMECHIRLKDAEWNRIS